MLDPKLLQKLKAEIAADPDGIYAGRTPAEIAELMTQPVVTVAAVPDIVIAEPPVVEEKTTTTIKDPPVFRVIMGEPGAPNAFTEQDIADAIGLK